MSYFKTRSNAKDSQRESHPLGLSTHGSKITLKVCSQRLQSFAVECCTQRFKSNVALDTSLDYYDSNVALDTSLDYYDSNVALDTSLDYYDSNVALDVNLDAWF